MSSELKLLAIIIIMAFAMLLLLIKLIIGDKKENKQVEFPRMNPIKTISYKEAMDIIDNMVKFECRNIVIKYGLNKKTDPELSVILDDFIITISETVYANIGHDLKDVLTSYVTDNYLKIYLKDSSRIVLVANLSVMSELQQ